MNDKDYSSAKVYATFRRAVRKFIECARTDLRRGGKFAKMSQTQRAAMGRAMAKLQEVMDCPRKFFSPDFTEEAWRARAKQYAAEKKLNNVADAYYFVQSPATIVWHMAHDLQVSAELNNEFFRLCDDFMQWEYRRESDKLDFGFFANNYAEKVVEHLNWLTHWEESNRTVYEKWKQLKRTNPLVKKFYQKLK